MPTTDLLAPLLNAEHREMGGVLIDTVRTGNSRVKRIVYPAGFRWSQNLKPLIGTELCQHAHVGFLASGHLCIEYADGVVEDFIAPQVVAIAPGHDGWVVGNEPVILIQFDFEGETVARLGLQR